MAEQEASSESANNTSSGYLDLLVYHNQKWIAALVAAALASFVLLWKVEIDATIETLILATWRLRTLSVYPTPLIFTGTVVGRY